LHRDDRHERLLTIKALGRIAYRHLKEAEIVGNITVGGEEKRWRKFEEDGLSAELLEPFRAAALSTEYSQIQIRFDGRKVFEIRWDRAGSFKATHFEPGEWERVLIDLPEPIPLSDDLK
jgi:hypothetical protein